MTCAKLQTTSLIFCKLKAGFILLEYIFFYQITKLFKNTRGVSEAQWLQYFTWKILFKNNRTYIY